jgi:hypothetical protein
MFGFECHVLSTCLLRGFTYVTAPPHMLYYNLFVNELITWHIRKQCIKSEIVCPSLLLNIHHTLSKTFQVHPLSVKF